MTTPGIRRLFANLATVVILACAIPVFGFVIAFPIWYLGTNHRAIYTAAAVLVPTVLLLRSLVRRR